MIAAGKQLCTAGAVAPEPYRPLTIGIRSASVLRWDNPGHRYEMARRIPR
jgi:hypothetical protein